MKATDHDHRPVLPRAFGEVKAFHVRRGNDYLFLFYKYKFNSMPKANYC